MAQLDFSADHILEDDRVLLRPLHEDDYAHLLPFALHEPELWKYSLVSAAGEEGLRHWIRLALDGRASEKEYPFIVFDKFTNSYAGSTRFYDINLPFETLQLGYTWYGKAFQGTGLNGHCKRLLLDFAFGQMAMQRVEFRADARNARSIAAMKKIGCTVEGILRSNMPTGVPGERRDSIVLSILRGEWVSNLATGTEARTKTT
jgi:RimJ/RimL family protein N-acetyltransferase